MVYFQGHASPGVYARAFLEGRLSEEHLNNFRHELRDTPVSSYPHPWLMKDFWQFPTVSMGLGPINSIYHARFMRYLEHRGLLPASDRKVWCFSATARWTSPNRPARPDARARTARQPDLRRQLQSAASRRAGARERQDHPGTRSRLPRRRLERDQGHLGVSLGRPPGPGRRRGPARPHEHHGRRRVPEAGRRVRGLHPGAFLRSGPAACARSSSDLSDDELVSLPRGGHDYRKLYAAYKLATEQRGAPTAILAKTIKGWTLGPEIEARNATHQIKKMTKAQLHALRDRLQLTDDIPD